MTSYWGGVACFPPGKGGGHLYGKAANAAEHPMADGSGLFCAHLLTLSVVSLEIRWFFATD